MQLSSKKEEAPPTSVIITEFPYVDTEGMTDLQKAVCITAESFVLRGNRAQYEDTRLIASKARNLWRWAYSYRDPEEYTSQWRGYSNCAAFNHDIFYSALDYDIVDYTTAQLTARKTDVVLTEKNPTNWSAEQKETAKKEFLEALEPGDLMVYRYGDGNGHVMMYVGNNRMIHCTGASFDWNNKAEKFEETGSFKCETIDNFWIEDNRRYLFNKESYRIVRPLLSFKEQIPQKTLDRMNKVRGIMAEKTATCTYSQTANLGQEITFTFTLENVTDTDKTLNLKETLSENLTYVSGADKADGAILSWRVTVPAKKTVNISYKAKVKEDAALIGEKIISNSFIESIPLNCPEIYIKKTLTDSEQTILVSTVNAFKGSNLRGIELADAIYKEAIGKSTLSGKNASEILSEMCENFSDNLDSWPAHWQKLKTISNPSLSMLAPNLYGGRYFMEPDGEERAEAALKRTRLVCADKLIIGDIILANTALGYEGENCRLRVSSYMFVGDKLLDLDKNVLIESEPRLEKLLCDSHFAVIRPSINM